MGLSYFECAVFHDFTLCLFEDSVVVRRFETVTSTALGISLTGIVFPRPPGQSGAISGTKKPLLAQAAVLPACGSFDAPCVKVTLSSLGVKRTIEA